VPVRRRGRDRSLLLDTGLADTSTAVIDPYLRQVGLEPDFVLISHADNDHVGGNRAFRDAHPDAVFACHELDRRWVESNEALVRENYGWHAAYGFPPMDAAELLASMGGDSPIDVWLSGGETIRLDAVDRTEALEWLAIGRAFVDDVERLVRDAPAEERDDLWALTQRVDAALGPFPQFTTELGATVREAAH
jgi:glyoxylase-like metal-dependent hydrolase (beta-lactamase superfamily II)